MKKKNRFWICTLIAITLILNIINSCKKEEEKTLPSVTTDNVNILTSHTATCGGNVTSDGNATITERGNKIVAAGTTGMFISSLTDLTAGTTYYVRAYAINSVGIAYGNEVTFTTLPLVLPTITTTNVTLVTPTTAQSGGNITSDGNTTITERGICYSTTTSPTIANSKLVAAGTLGIFTSNLTDLTAGTTYYLRAYATNSIGTAYGSEISFTTYNIDAISDIDNNYYNIIIIGTQTWMKENLKTTKYIDGSTINNITDNSAWTSQTNGAFCWYNNDADTYKNTYGALYNYFAVVDSRNLCPVGWHVPTKEEWIQLANYAGDWSVAGTKLKATNGWNGNGNGTDIFGFSALPGGSRGGSAYGGAFMGIGNNGMWWSSTEYSVNNAYHWYMTYDSGGVSGLVPDKDSGFSIRCVKDN